MSKPFRAVVTGHSFPSLDLERDVLAGTADLVESQPRNREEVIAAARTADAVLNQNSQIDAEVIESLERCRVIVAYGIGTDKIDLEAATRRGIQVCNVPDYCLEEVAAHTVALLLAMERRVPQLMAALRAGRWVQPEPGDMRRLSGRTLGCLGFGRIARRVAAVADALGLRAIAHDPMLDAGQAGVCAVGFEQLLEDSDYLTIHCPLTPETRGLIDGEALGRMRPGAMLINASRGKIVQEAALVEALQAGRLRGAALDVFEAEPLAQDSPLLHMDQVVLTPHVAWFSTEAEEELKRTVAMEARRALLGEPPQHPVNRPRPREYRDG